VKRGHLLGSKRISRLKTKTNRQTNKQTNKQTSKKERVKALKLVNGARWMNESPRVSVIVLFCLFVCLFVCFVCLLCFHESIE